MSCYAFRFINENGEPTGHVGFAYAKNNYELFWQIDEHGDPWCVEVKKMRSASICVRLTNKDEALVIENDVDFEFDSIEFCEEFMFDLLDPKWSKPKWDKSEVYQVRAGHAYRK